jgi:Amt family ammonium transporter
MGGIDMKSQHLLPLAGLAGLLLVGPALAQDAEPVAEVMVATVDKGDTTWMMVSTLLVIMMTIPGLALFYGGMVRAKNMLSMLMQVFAGFCMIALLWVAYGYSLAFAGPESGGISPFIGDLSKLFLAGVTPDSTAATFTEGVEIPELTFVIFQLTFGAITPALIIGAVAERMKFGSMMLFIALWFTFAYLPIAHMVWSGPGFLFGIGALDFAGGTVVHINAGVAGLVAALIVGPRAGFLKEPIPPHNLTFSMIGACLLWVGWFGFNAGSALSAGTSAVNAFVVTHLCAASGLLGWDCAEWIINGKPSVLGACSGLVAGLVVITPACGFVEPMGAIVMGLIGGPVCYFACVKVKGMLGYDDSLDAFGVHGVGGTLGALLTVVFVSSAVDAGAAEHASMMNQVISLMATYFISIVGTFVFLKIIDLVIGLRVSEPDEVLGLDQSQHSEDGYIFQ